MYHLYKMNWLRNYFRYIILALFVAVNGLIIFESSLSGGASSVRSHLVTVFVGDVINKTVPPKPYTQVGVESMSLANHEGTLLAENETYFIPLGITRRLTPTLYPAHATDKGVTYVSSDPSILRATQGGFLEARKLGAVTINVTSNNNSNVTQTIRVQVNEKLAPPTYTLTLEKDTIDVETTSRLLVHLSERDAREFDAYKLPFYSSNKSVATINEYGVIVAKSVGMTTVGVSGNDQTFTVTVNAPLTPVILADDFTLAGPSNNVAYVYDKTPLNILMAENVTDKSLTLLSSNEAIGKIIEEDGSYYVYGTKVSGSVTITALLNTNATIKKELTLTMQDILPTAIAARFEKDNSVIAGSRLKIIPTLSHALTGKENVPVTNQEIKYTVADTSIASASSDGDFGWVVGKKAGTTTVVLTSVANNELTTTLTVTITLKPRINDENINNLHGFLRKFFGHFSLFFLDGVLGLLTFYFFLKKPLWQNSLFSLGVGTFFAALSEVIQYFVPRRAGLFADVLIDVGGYLAATLIMYFIIYLSLRHKKPKLQK